MTVNWIAELESKTQPELVALREDITTRAKGQPTSLPIEELEKLCAIFELLRRKHSGPPKKSNGKAPPKIDLAAADF